MAKAFKSKLEGTKALMGALLRQPPKQHDEIRVGKVRSEKNRKRKAKAKG
jgi:hypothetical protein